MNRMMFKLKFFMPIFMLLFSISCKQEIARDYSAEISDINHFTEATNYNKKIAFMIDYSLHSGLPRFFIVDLKANKIIDKALVCHGSCKGENSNEADYCKHISNIEDTNCTSLGFSLIGERAYSKWGKNYKYWLDGLEKTNNNMRKRVVVLHAWKGVPDKSIYPTALTTSWGCPTVSIDFLDKLDSILKTEKSVLLYSFK